MSTATYGNPVFRERHRTYGNTKSAERLCWRVPMFLLTMMNMHSNPQHYWMYNTMRVLSPYFQFVQIVFHLVSLARVSSLVCAAF